MPPPRRSSTRRRSRRPATVVMTTTEEPTARDRAVRHHPKEAKPGAEEVPLNFAICRSLQHGWQHRLEPVRGFHEVGFESVCGSCGTVRTKWINDRDGATRNSYKYPAGYGAEPGEPRFTPSEWRANLLRRL